MVIYIATIWAKPGSENAVSTFYQSLEPQLRASSGFRSRRIMRARAGTMVAAVRKMGTTEADHGGHGPKGTQFIIVEEWDSVEQRLEFSRGASAARGKELFPHILPEHSHEFYEDISPG
jgi:quinol monooxygenase YgiN